MVQILGAVLHERSENVFGVGNAFVSYGPGIALQSG